MRWQEIADLKWQRRRKKPKTLSGIETRVTTHRPRPRKFGAGKNLKPYQGLKRGVKNFEQNMVVRRKKPKTLSGIETKS